MNPIEIVLALLLPPVAVAMKRGIGRSFLIAILLTLLGHLPGVIYAFSVTAKD